MECTFQAVKHEIVISKVGANIMILQLNIY